MVAAPNLASKSWITSQYDRYVLGNTVLAQPEDAGMIRIDEVTGRGVAISTDCNGRFAKLDPYEGAQSGARRELPQRRGLGCGAARRHQLPELRLARGPRGHVAVRRGDPRSRGRLPELGVPVTGGNVSFYNQTGGTRSCRRPSSACWA
jgi:phosphoribosylformylglycinamidine (FGAM) synthase-like enzyme